MALGMSHGGRGLWLCARVAARRVIESLSPASLRCTTAAVAAIRLQWWMRSGTRRALGQEAAFWKLELERGS